MVLVLFYMWFVIPILMYNLYVKWGVDG